MVTKRRLALASSSALLAGLPLVLMACPRPEMPKGPAPEYEPPARPSWLVQDAAVEDATPPQRV
jgi:hypothetical protein